ncbi:uncharacterized protein LOC124656272 [Lolium rigidum]|uniref:uncharacterized protein LOC124656272 n=1 Tax=Lolium rigidum TaxID=89674 RepID=UPI001F5E1AC2|nr:uncharacterized protein LOC124656272 [Lolium rigidum]
MDGDVAGLAPPLVPQAPETLRHRISEEFMCRLERETGVSFLPAHLHLLLFQGKWAEAEAYVAGPIDFAGCSWMASLIIARIRVFDVMSRFAAGEASTVSNALFRRAEEHLLANPKLHGTYRLLHSMRSDQDKASKLYRRFHQGAVEAIMGWVAKCPELKSKMRPKPSRSFDPTYFVSLGPRFWDCRRRGKKSKAGRRIPAHTLAHFFVRKLYIAASSSKA